MLKKEQENKEIEELLLALLPLWNYKITKPLKQSLETGISMEMYYCIQVLRSNQGSINMGEIAKRMNMSKQQATKLIDKMVEHKLVERCFDEKDRRVIKIQQTKYSKQYIDYFLQEKVDCFNPLLMNMEEQNKSKFKKALKEIYCILAKE